MSEKIKMIINLLTGMVTSYALLWGNRTWQLVWGYLNLGLIVIMTLILIIVGIIKSE